MRGVLSVRTLIDRMPPPVCNKAAMTARSDDERFMALALALGRRGLGRTWPNPAVGAVIVRDDGAGR